MQINFLSIFGGELLNIEISKRNWRYSDCNENNFETRSNFKTIMYLYGLAPFKNRFAIHKICNCTTAPLFEITRIRFRIVNFFTSIKCIEITADSCHGFPQFFSIIFFRLTDHDYIIIQHYKAMLWRLKYIFAFIVII